jgi:hypothetical protein
MWKMKLKSLIAAFMPRFAIKYHSGEKINKVVLQQLRSHHKRSFQKKDFGRLDLFTQSGQPLLQSLPTDLYIMKFETQAKVQRNYHVILGQDLHQYSIPYSYW